MFLRWSWFPWNSVVRTSIAVSTGLNYAFEVTPLEIGRANNGGKGSHLMHYLAPEAAFALPQHPDFELLFRFHHRSGGREIFCDSGIFNCAVGGSQYLSAGFRVRF